jgi:NTP pyrophosphatase (non-canonical NTP hydrolase)
MFKNLDEYKEKAITTAIYPKSSKIIYPVLGLADETGEFYEKFKVQAKNRKGLIQEIGDCFWYVANVCNDIDLIMSSLMDELEEVEYSEESIEDYLFSMITSSTKICGITKKWIRDEDNEGLSDEKLIEINFELSQYWIACLGMCKYLDITWQEVAQLNIDKLSSRKERNKIKGSGDNR